MLFLLIYYILNTEMITCTRKTTRPINNDIYHDKSELLYVKAANIPSYVIMITSLKIVQMSANQLSTYLAENLESLSCYLWPHTNTFFLLGGPVPTRWVHHFHSHNFLGEKLIKSWIMLHLSQNRILNLDLWVSSEIIFWHLRLQCRWQT